MTDGLAQPALPDLLAWLVLLALLAAVTWEDVRSHRIPNALNAALLGGGLLASAVTGTPSLPAALIGAALGACALLAVALSYRRLRGYDGLGLGDVKFLAGAGAWTGWQGVGPTIFVAAAAALLWVATRRLAGATVDNRHPIAFGPFLCLALIAVRAAQQGGLLVGG